MRAPHNIFSRKEHKSKWLPKLVLFTKSTHVFFSDDLLRTSYL